MLPSILLSKAAYIVHFNVRDTKKIHNIRILRKDYFFLVARQTERSKEVRLDAEKGPYFRLKTCIIMIILLVLNSG